MPKQDKSTSIDTPLVEFYSEGIDLLKRVESSGIESELGKVSKKPSITELIFRLKEFYTIGNVIADVAKTLIEFRYKSFDNKDKTIENEVAQIKKYDLTVLNVAYTTWFQSTADLLYLYEASDDFLYSKENLLNKFTDEDLYKISKTSVRDLDVESVFSELGKRQKALHSIIVELEDKNEKIVNNDSSSTNSNTKEEITAEIKLIGNEVALWLSSSGSIPIKSLRLDGPQYNFINYLLAHPNTNLSRGDVRLKIDGCNDIDDLTEVVRYCGFDKQLKRLFFEHCTQLRVQFRPTIELPILEADHLIKKYKS